MNQRRLTFDLDGTLCTDTNGRYDEAKPIAHRIAKVRQLAAEGCHLTIDTARGALTGIDWLEETAAQLRQWGVPYDELRVGVKPFAHTYVGDEAVNAADFFAEESGHAERWPDEYFAQRHGNDSRRAKAFDSECNFLTTHKVWRTEAVCDIGCSTGEFLEFFKWSGPRYGMEISTHARMIAQSHGINFDRNIFTETDFFDVVIFRGTIQHLPHPFRYIERAFKALKPGGHVCFLATPNTGSIVYRLFQELPVSDDARNYWMPSAKTLSNALQNFGFEIVAVEYPYLSGGYARPLADTLAFARRLARFGKTDFPWKGNMMNVVARKP